MSDLFGISVSALQAFQNAITVTSNNVANASTPGYDAESVNLTEAIPQANGAATVGSGVAVSGVSRAFSQAAANQLYASQSTLGQLTGLQNYTTQIDNLFGTNAGGLSNALTAFYNGWSDVANDPSSTAARQALLGKAQSVAASFQSTASQLNGLSTDVNARISQDVTQINSIANSISALNKQIVVGSAQAGQPPNELLDQRDQLVSSLSGLVGVTTTTDSDGSLNVFVGKGQPLVLDGLVTPLTTVADQYDASQLDVSTGAANGNVIDSTLASGDLAGLFAARSQAIDPALNQLGQVAAALSQTVNSQQSSGLDLNGQLGAALFSVSGPQAVASSKNTGTATAAVSIADLSALGADDYILKYQGGAYSLTDATSGASVSLSGTGSAANPLTGAGISIVVAGPPASGDTFSIQPTRNAAGGIAVVLNDPSKLAAAGAVLASASAANTGTATVDSGSVVDPTNPNLLNSASIVFSSPTSYSIDGGPAQTYVDGANIDANGWQVAISGAPAAGDTFNVARNTGAGGDNRNALASAAQQSTGVLSGGNTSIPAAVSALITGIGSQAQQVNTAQTAQTAINTQASASVQSVSGVNLDEEAASLLKWQQAYQAAAQALAIGNSLFSTLIASVNGTNT